MNQFILKNEHGTITISDMEPDAVLKFESEDENFEHPINNNLRVILGEILVNTLKLVDKARTEYHFNNSAQRN